MGCIGRRLKGEKSEIGIFIDPLPSLPSCHELAVSLPKATAPTEWSSPSATPNYIIILPEPMLHPLRLHHKVLPLAGMKSGSLINEFTLFMSSCI